MGRNGGNEGGRERRTKAGIFYFFFEAPSPNLSSGEGLSALCFPGGELHKVRKKGKNIEAIIIRCVKKEVQNLCSAKKNKC